MDRTLRALPLFVALSGAAMVSASCRSNKSQGTSHPTTAAPGRPAPRDPASASKGGDPPAAPERPAADPEPERLAGITAAHNRIRERLGLPPLVWSDEVARFAQAWADRLKRERCEPRHRPRSGPDTQRYGENIYASVGSTPTPGDVVDTWAAEAKGYDAKSNRCRGVCGHYTQIVWRKSQRLGCAMAACGDAEVWVCNYDPPGNFLGERPF